MIFSFLLSLQWPLVWLIVDCSCVCVFVWVCVLVSLTSPFHLSLAVLLHLCRLSLQQTWIYGTFENLLLPSKASQQIAVSAWKTVHALQMINDFLGISWYLTSGQRDGDHRGRSNTNKNKEKGREEKLIQKK